MRLVARETVRVEIDDTKYVVTFNENDKPLAVKERRMYAPGTPYSAFYDAPLWHHSHSLGPRSKFRPIIEAARKVLNARRTRSA